MWHHRLEGGLSGRGHQDQRPRGHWAPTPRQAPYPTTHLPCWSPLHPSPTSPEDVNKASANLALPLLGLILCGCLCDWNKEVHLPLDSSLGTPLRVAGACLSCSVFTTWASQGRGLVLHCLHGPWLHARPQCPQET